MPVARYHNDGDMVMIHILLESWDTHMASDAELSFLRRAA